VTDAFAMIWELEHHGEVEPLRALFLLGDALSNLALSADEQERTIPDCPFCELVQPFWASCEAFGNSCQAFQTEEVLKALSAVQSQLERLPKDSTECFNSKVFYTQGWPEVRSLARELLVLLHWEELSSSRGHLSALK
jgi:hypothetical protein